MNYQHKIKWLKSRLTQPLPGRIAQQRMAPRLLPDVPDAPPTARVSAVLCLLFPIDNVLNVLLIKRMEDKSAHSGQVSFPGGSKDASDIDLKATALREAEEEVGINTADVEIIGELTPLYIPVSNFSVHPFVGYAHERLTYKLSTNEVASIMEVPLKELCHESAKTKVEVTSPALPGIVREVNAYKLEDGTIIWGATAMMLSELETVMAEYPYNYK